jgi:hypothetical protein
MSDLHPEPIKQDVIEVKPVPVSSSKRPLINGCAAVIIVLILAAVLLALVPPLMGYNLAGQSLSVLQSIFSPKPAVASVMSSQTIVNSILPMGQLVSVSAQVAKADISVGIQQGALNACGFSAKHVAQGTVEAGIDLTQLSENSVSFDEKTNTYTINLPAAQLTSCRVDFIRQYDRSTTTCAVDWDEARLLANYEAITQFRDDSLEGGIRTRAEREAKIVLGNFIKLLTGKDVVINFIPATMPIIPASCQPEVPSGWTYKSDINAWIKS